ncbi:predicted protein [Sclerotinia sclerotiorum 1980 UF-70]|uniref:Uncharacterized protein n=1 Tax=Sclerotinia sclerotiorum (strain ATCC 18683 / 1980 / Ss-1) TaxID=665079 RepID=A7E7C0_SCLS1|nr:predicted protein [Sclerotinia sclerotiorum 1980 UF-70]EDN96272.1 predicted protein [Sclerotinia sclerotiorum 1980 UF-70]
MESKIFTIIKDSYIPVDKISLSRGTKRGMRTTIELHMTPSPNHSRSTTKSMHLRPNKINIKNQQQNAPVLSDNKLLYEDKFTVEPNTIPTNSRNWNYHDTNAGSIGYKTYFHTIQQLSTCLTENLDITSDTSYINVALYKIQTCF